MSRRLGALFCAVLVVPALLGLVPAAAHAADGPQITSGPTEPITVNPDRQPVEITVSWDGGGEVHAQWGDVVTVVQPGVPTPISFGAATSGTHPITVFACSTPTEGQPQFCNHAAGPVVYDDATAAVTVDRVPPVPSVNLTAQKLYPVVDGYKDVAWLTPDADDAAGRFDLSVVDAAGTPVRTWTREQALEPGDIGWDGRNDAHAIVPDGVYHAKLVVEDAVGNQATAVGGAITVSGQHLVARTWDVVALARDVLARKDQTRCSTVRTPSLRGWRGSIGYYSNSRCKAASFAGSVASGVHAARLPSAVVPGTLTISAYGGAAKGHRRSTAVLAAYDPNGDFLGSPSRLGSALGWHRTTTRAAAKMLHGRDVAWNVFTSRGARYDVRGFRLVYRYQVLSD